MREGDRDGVPVLRRDDDTLEASDVLARVADEVRVIVASCRVGHGEPPEVVPEIVPREEAMLGEADEHPVHGRTVEREAPHGREHLGTSDRGATRPQKVALGISHPILTTAPLNISAVVIEDVTGFEQDEEGLRERIAI